MIRVVIPISHFDESLAEDLLKHLSDQGDSSHGFPCLVVLDSKLSDKEDHFKALAEQAFKSAYVKVCARVEEGWPLGPNSMFKCAVDGGSPTPWLWLEPDCTPLTRDWLIQIVTEYNQRQKRFLGVTRPTNLRDAEGKIVGTDGEHMIGVGVYPQDFSSMSTLWRYLDDETPWDVYCRWEIRPRLAETDLIAHNWRSTNFRGERQSLLWDGEDQTPIPAEAVLHHGCKDGSLLRIVWGGAQERKEEKPSQPVDLGAVRLKKRPALTLPDEE